MAASPSRMPAPNSSIKFSSESAGAGRGSSLTDRRPRAPHFRHRGATTDGERLSDLRRRAGPAVAAGGAPGRLSWPRQRRPNSLTSCGPGVESSGERHGVENPSRARIFVRSRILLDLFRPGAATRTNSVTSYWPLGFNKRLICRNPAQNTSLPAGPIHGDSIDGHRFQPEMEGCVP